MEGACVRLCGCGCFGLVVREVMYGVLAGCGLSYSSRRLSIVPLLDME